MSVTRELSEQDKRLNQMWDWGHNCKVLNFSEEVTSKTLSAWDNFKSYSIQERDRFWEGFNAPKSRRGLIAIFI